MKEYTLERRMINVKTGWFKSEVKPMWCLVESGKYYDYDYYCSGYVDYSAVILQSEDKAYIEQELANFRGVI